jgi:class 3 adenylate cyclase
MAEARIPPSAEPFDALARGRAALARHAWHDALALLMEADGAANLGGADLEALAEAAFFAARPDIEVEAKERAFTAYAGEPNPVRAAYIALTLTREYGYRGKPSIASAWMRRGERLLDSAPESYAHGYLALVRSETARSEGDTAAAVGLAEQAIAISERTRDEELRAWGLAGLGSLRIAEGAAPDGLALLEEASIAAVNGELSPFATGVICCTMISACRDLTDYERAAQWIEATDRYCARQSVSGFPGACRIHRAEIVALSGGWERAESELRQATTELGTFGASPPLGDGFYALGEVHRLRGELDAAEDALRKAHALGRSPHPALALVRLARGQVDAATAAIGTAVSEASWHRWARASLLPAQVEIALAAGDRRLAREAAEELAAMVETYPSPALQAGAHGALGRVLLAEQDPSSAAAELRSSMGLWRKVGNPYEVARGRALLAETLRQRGDEEDADLELRAARDEFARLGAAIDLAATERAAAILEERRRPPAQVRRTFMFTDIVDSTPLAETLGNVAWEGLLGWHDRTLRGLIDRGHGQVVHGTGDGFFAAFEVATEAVETARSIQRALSSHREDTGFAPAVRIGLHTAAANRRGGDYSGMGVHVAARVAAVAEAGEILATDETVAESATAAANHRAVRLKGVSTLIGVASVA